MTLYMPNAKMRDTLLLFHASHLLLATVFGYGAIILEAASL